MFQLMAKGQVTETLNVLVKVAAERELFELIGGMVIMFSDLKGLLPLSRRRYFERDFFACTHILEMLRSRIMRSGSPLK